MTSWRYPWPLTLSILYLIPMISIFSKYILFSPFLLLLTSFIWQLIIQYLLDGKQGIWPCICWDFNVGKLLVFLSWTIIIAHWLVICVLSAFRIILTLLTKMKSSHVSLMFKALTSKIRLISKVLETTFARMCFFMLLFPPRTFASRTWGNCRSLSYTTTVN